MWIYWNGIMKRHCHVDHIITMYHEAGKETASLLKGIIHISLSLFKALCPFPLSTRNKLSRYLGKCSQSVIFPFCPHQAKLPSYIIYQNFEVITQVYYITMTMLSCFVGFLELLRKKLHILNCRCINITGKMTKIA